MKQLLFWYLFTCTLFAQQLTLDQIMQGDDFIGHSPTNARWSTDGNTIFFEWNPNQYPLAETYFWSKGMTTPQKYNGNQAETYLGNAAKDALGNIYYIKEGALFTYHQTTKKSKKIYQSSQPISNVTLGNSPGIIYFQQSQQLFQWNQNTNQLLQITNFQSGKAPEKAPKANYLQKQQEELFAIIQKQKHQQKWQDSIRKLQKEFFPKPYYYGRASLEQITVSPSGKHLTFRVTEYPSPVNTKVEHFVTQDGFTENKNARPKVSIKNFPKHQMFLMDVERDTVYSVDFSKLTNLSKQPKYWEEYPDAKIEELGVDGIVMQAPVFSDDGKYAVLEVRSLNNKKRWLVQLNLKEGSIKELDAQYDEAWIAGPGIPNYAQSRGVLKFFPNTYRVYFQSEATGYSHVYQVDLVSGKKEALTKGNWEVREVIASKNAQILYLVTNQTHPGNREVQRLEVATKKLTTLFAKQGAFEAELSPDEKYWALRFSSANQPWELYVVENKKDAKLQQLTQSTTKSFNQYPWITPEVVTFTAEDGTKVYARLYIPKQEVKNQAAVIFVHGAGYLQNAHNYWSTYHREYMFHHLLMEKGYTVLDIDYRGSDGYGRDFRTGIYRHMGGLDLSDHVDGKNYLVQKHGIDANRVGIYGGSYGGFITLMALFTEPGQFAAGAALRAVTDWAHYNHPYTGNILNYPETDPIAFERSSPIYFAQNLQDPLLILHGMVDDNVQYQDVVRLSQRLIELKKKNWEMASYPIEAHGFKETTSWIDEYQRILNHFEKHLRK